MYGLYIHIPFCVSQCNYCNFYRIAPIKQSNVNRFLSALAQELKNLPTNFAPTTIFIGGGTPTALPDPQLKQLLQTLQNTIDLSNITEFSCEANPGTLTPKKCTLLRTAGINRISMGIQTFNPTALKMLGRIHTPLEAKNAFQQLRSAGFKQISLDLLQSLPCTTLKQTLDDCQQAIELNPEHISSYNLIYEPGTKLTTQRNQGTLQEIDEDDEANRYFAVKNIFEKAGYEHYEISNFSKPTYASRHNQLYWNGEEYLGCGPAAHSHWNGKRFGNIENLDTYCTRLETGQKPYQEKEHLPPKQKARETLIMQLRMLKGVHLKHFKHQTGYTPKQLAPTAINELLEQKLLLQNNTHLRINPNALFISNTIFSALI